MKIIVAVVVYDRLNNVEEWIRCWKQCDTRGSELYIIHNYKNEAEMHQCRTSCENAGVRHIPRRNVGMDIGALQDVCRGRLEGFPNQWDYLLWATDDVIPMSKDFIHSFLEAVKKPGIGAACLEISPEVKTHIRTTGFMISQQTASKLTFPAPTILTKAQCYEFEHKSKTAFYEQIRNMGKKAVQVHPDTRRSCMWDTHIRSHFNRWREHYQRFPLEKKSMEDKKITIICPIYNRFPQIVGCLLNQTHENWQLLLIHDGPSELNLREIICAINDKRIKYIETPERQGLYGHPIRKMALEKMDELSPGTNFVYITNDDNTIVPHGLEYFLEGFNQPGTLGVYCSNFVHSYLSPQVEGDHKYGVIKTQLQLGYLDISCVVFKKEVACEIGWNSMEYSSDWEFISAISVKYGKDKFKRILGTLVNHN